MRPRMEVMLLFAPYSPSLEYGPRECLQRGRDVPAASHRGDCRFAFHPDRCGEFPFEISLGVEDSSVANIAPAVGTMSKLVDFAPAVFDMSALAEHDTLVTIDVVSELYKMMVIDFTKLFATRT